MSLRFCALFLIAAWSAAVWHTPAGAHDARPAYLEITETIPSRYAVLWRTPTMSGTPLPVRIKLPETVRNVTEPAQRGLTDSTVERWMIEAPEGGLVGQRIDFVGLQGTITDVLVRTQLLDGSQSTTLVRPSQPWIEIVAPEGAVAITGTYVAHGVEHILFGFDHLLFVLALILIIRDRSLLFFTVTAFTAAHSITLSLATLGLVSIPGPPVEASIALSILLLACEIVRLQRGEPGLTARYPWVVAFSFGLLHGLGFATALTEIGLPRGDIPLALLSFNVGVEIGQLTFIAVVLGLLAFARTLRLASFVERHVVPAATYGIGGIAAFWLVDRIEGFWT
jgi:hydrogenase/urease accessory protein HupE